MAATMKKKSVSHMSITTDQHSDEKYWKRQMDEIKEVGHIKELLIDVKGGKNEFLLHQLKASHQDLTVDHLIIFSSTSRSNVEYLFEMFPSWQVKKLSLTFNNIFYETLPKAPPVASLAVTIKPESGNDRYYQLLSEYIIHNKKLESFSLESLEEINVERFQLLVEALSSNKGVKKVRLAYWMTNKHLQILVDRLAAHIVELDLSRNQMTDYGLLGKLISGRELRKLNMKKNLWEGDRKAFNEALLSRKASLESVAFSGYYSADLPILKQLKDEAPNLKKLGSSMIMSRLK